MELWDLYTVDRVKTGETIVRGEPIPADRYHLQVHVIIFNSRGEMLIQQRTPTKRYYPNLWDVSVGGGAVSGDTSSLAAEREVQEELGVTVHLNGKRPDFTMIYNDCFDDYYIVKMDAELSSLTLQETEVQAAAWANKDEVFRMMRDGTFCPNLDGLITLLFELHEKGLPR